MLDAVKEAWAYYPVVELAAYVALFYVPQWARIVRRRSSGDVSVVSFAANLAANAGFAVYGAWYATASYVLACAVGAACSAATIALVLKYRKEGERGE